ncbi:hypothetical protein HGRIS_013780 [Hohenbuehelia grisea]|uniref:Uncharacterized protein n=1 Tax=Hohenbuehelia grisea TaxID=104357 RepID=A0ABR3IWS9_9AGAR
MMRDVGGIDRTTFVDYTGIVESSLPFSILGIAFAVALAKNSNAGPALTFICGTFCVSRSSLSAVDTSAGFCGVRPHSNDDVAVS